MVARGERNNNNTTTTTTTITNNNNNDDNDKTRQPVVCDAGWRHWPGNYTRSLTAREARNNINTITTTTNNNDNKSTRQPGQAAVCVMLGGGIGQVTIPGH